MLQRRGGQMQTWGGGGGGGEGGVGDFSFIARHCMVRTIGAMVFTLNSPGRSNVLVNAGFPELAICKGFRVSRPRPGVHPVEMASLTVLWFRV